MFYFQIVLTLSFFCIRFITFQYCGRLVLTLSFFYVRFSIFMYSIRLVLVLSVFCASFIIYMETSLAPGLPSLCAQTSLKGRLMQEDCCGGCGSPSDRGACYVRAAAQLTPHLNIVAHRCRPAGYIGGLPGLRSSISYMAVWEWNG